jgi:hypothetical protein
VEVEYHTESERELNALPAEEKIAMVHAVEKLRHFGDRLPFPHSSMVKGATKLRELRPRAGRSRWRAFYRRVGNIIIIAAIGPEASVDRQRFRRAMTAAQQRFDELESGGVARQ